MNSKTSTVTPHFFFAFLAKVQHYLPAWQVKKKSVVGNILDANVLKQQKSNKAAGLEDAITAKALQGGGDIMAEVLHSFCNEVYATLIPPDKWITNAIIPLPRKGDLSLMTNYRGISLISIAAKVCNKILLNRIRSHIDPILRKNQAGFRKDRRFTSS